MLDIVMISVICLLIVNLVVALIVMARRIEGSNWLLAVLLTGTTGAALAAILAGQSGEETSRFVDLSLILVGLAAVSVVISLVVGIGA